MQLPREEAYRIWIDEQRERLGRERRRTRWVVSLTFLALILGLVSGDIPPALCAVLAGCLYLAARISSEVITGRLVMVQVFKRDLDRDLAQDLVGFETE